MQYVPIPVDKLALGKPLPVDVWDPHGKLLLRKGQNLSSEHERDMLEAHQASVTESDANAWFRAFQRRVQAHERDGATTQQIAALQLPSDIDEADYLFVDALAGDWLDLQDVLQTLLYQGADAAGGALRIERLESRARDLLADAPDQSLFTLFQALADSSLGYCATHALLSAVVCELTAQKIGIDDVARRTLFRSALVMNIGMARAQDKLATQPMLPNDSQRIVIRDHAERGADLLQQWGVDDTSLIDIVRWHHEPDAAQGAAQTQQSRRLLHVADVFVAKLAARKTRLAMSALGAARSMVVDETSEAPTLASAVATAVGFYPPGTYVQLVNGERAVVVARGLRAHDAHVVSIVNAGGMPLGQYAYRDSAQPRFAIRAPVNAEKIRVRVSREKAYAAWAGRMAG